MNIKVFEFKMDETWELIFKMKNKTVLGIDGMLVWDATCDELRLPMEFMLRPMVGLIDSELTK